MSLTLIREQRFITIIIIIVVVIVVISIIISSNNNNNNKESRFGLAVRLVSGRTSVRYRFGSHFSSKVVVCGHCLVILSLTMNETLKWPSSLPILMQVILVVTVQR